MDYEEHRRAEIQAEIERADRFRQVANDIAAALDATFCPWESVDGPEITKRQTSGTITHGDYALHLSGPNTYGLRKNGKEFIRVSGSYAGNIRDVTRYDEKLDHEMTVDMAKGGERIAKEINRRILSRVIELTQRIAQRKAEQSSAACDRDAAVADIEHSVPGVQFYPAGSRIGATPTDTSYMRSHGAPCEVSVRPGGQIELERIYTDAKTAAAILLLLKARANESES